MEVNVKERSVLGQVCKEQGIKGVGCQTGMG